MRFTVLCLLNEGRGMDMFKFSSIEEARAFRRKLIRRYAYIFITDLVLEG